MRTVIASSVTEYGPSMCITVRVQRCCTQRRLHCWPHPQMSTNLPKASRIATHRYVAARGSRKPGKGSRRSKPQGNQAKEAELCPCCSGKTYKVRSPVNSGCHCYGYSQAHLHQC